MSIKRLLIGVLAALAVGLGVAPTAQADHCDPGHACHEFDWADPFYDAWELHGLLAVAQRVGIPVAVAADNFCDGEDGAFWQDEYVRTRLTVYEIAALAQALYDEVCPWRDPQNAVAR
jgi:hypothetical protein